MAQRAEEGGVVGSGRGGGAGVWGEGPCAGAAPPLRAAQPFKALSPRGGRLHLCPPPSPSQYGYTALGAAKHQKQTEVIKILENPAAYLAAQVGRAAPHPPPRRTAPAPCATDACSRIPGCSLTALSRPGHHTNHRAHLPSLVYMMHSRPPWPLSERLL